MRNNARFLTATALSFLLLHSAQSASAADLRSCEALFRSPIPAIRGTSPLKQTLIEKSLGPLGLTRMREAYMAALRDSEPVDFFTKLLKQLNVAPAFDPNTLDAIPKEGPLVVTANHPTGLLDGMVLASVMKQVRPDTKVLMTSALELPALSADIIQVDVYGDRKANLTAMREALQWLKDGHSLIVFPAGEVSHVRSFRDEFAKDSEWKANLAGLIEHSSATTLPVFIHGQNSRLFQYSGLVNSNLRTLQLLRETVRKRGEVMPMEIGAPIKPSTLTQLASRNQWMEFLRARTYAMRPTEEVKAKSATPERDTSKFESIHEGPTRETLSAMVARVQEIPGTILIDKNDYQVLAVDGAMLAKASQDGARLFESFLDEIGRLREETFRKVGEGTGRARDFDSYDRYYTHLFVWSKKDSEIIGAYRLGLSDKIVAQYGVEGLYTHNQFKFDKRLIDDIGPAIELGRAFVQEKYQRSLAGLPALFSGIASFVAAHPEYRSLYGSVSISNDYSNVSKTLMVDYLSKNFKDEAHDGWVRVGNPPKFSTGLSTAELDVLRSGVTDPKSMDNLISTIEGKPMPVLINKYIAMGSTYLAFDFDRAFNTVDGFIIVDMPKLGATDRKRLEMFMGKANTEAYLNHHGVGGAAAPAKDSLKPAPKTVENTPDVAPAKTRGLDPSLASGQLKFDKEAQPSGEIMPIVKFLSAEGRELGKITYEILKDGSLSIGDAYIVTDKRGKGIYGFLVAKILEKHPRIQAIEGILASDNFAVFKREMTQNRKSLEEAIKATPSYRMRATLGFTEIDWKTTAYDGSQYVVLRTTRPQG